MAKNPVSFALIALCGVCVLSVAAHADKDKHKRDDDKDDKSSNQQSKSVNQRQERQQERIHNGRDSGELTRHEAKQLKERASQIRDEEKAARRSGGKFTQEERQRIQGQLDNLGQDIHRQKDDDQRSRPREHDNYDYGPDYDYYSGGHRYSGTYYSPGYFPDGPHPDGLYPGSLVPPDRYPGAGYPSRRYPTGRYPGGYYPDPDWPGTRYDRQPGVIGEGREPLGLGDAAVVRDRKRRIRGLEARLHDPKARLTPAERYGIERELDTLRREVASLTR